MNPVQRLAEVVTLPTRLTDTVDDWGRDPEFVQRFRNLSGLRWNTSVGGAEHLPRRTGALVVVNARRFALAPMFAALAVGEAVDRPVRFVGRPDVAPFGPLMQRIGALLEVEGEIEGALRAGEVVVVGAHHAPGNRRSGTVDHRLLGAAVATRVRVLPAATISFPTRRSARVEIGPAVRQPRGRRGPLDELEIADLVQRHIDALLEEYGGVGTPFDWLPFDRLWGT